MEPEPIGVTEEERELTETWGRITADLVYVRILKQWSEPRPHLVMTEIPPGKLKFVGAEEVKLDGKPTGEASFVFEWQE